MPEPPTTSTRESILAATGIRKTFGGVTALDGVDFALQRGEIHGVVGQNGAGKSTLVKILNGVHQPEAGSITMNGEEVMFQTPLDACEHGIAMVFQEFSLVATLTVAQNVFLAHEPRTRTGLVDDRTARSDTKARLSALGVEIDPMATVGALPVGGQQLVEIAKAMSQSPAILILDEPTASLAHGEVASLFSVLRRLSQQGVSIIYISHHLNEVMSLCDQLTVLRDGRVTLRGTPSTQSLDAVVIAMTGSASGALAGAASAGALDEAPVSLEVSGLSLGRRLEGVNLTVRRGEVLGVAGLLGSGRTSLLRALMGLEPDAQGRVALDGREIRARSPADATELGLAYVPEDRRREGVIEGQSVESNLLLSIWHALARFGLLRGREVRWRARSLIDRFGIRTAGPDQLIQHLSGGNQQKVVVGRALAMEPQVLLLDDPTAGIDIGSRRELLGHVRRFADAGNAVILVSSELEELAEVCDRVLILRRGTVGRTLSRTAGDAVTEASLLAAIQSERSTRVAPNAAS
jgi:ribose transport system ATP-binding protein